MGHQIAPLLHLPHMLEHTVASIDLNTGRRHQHIHLVPEPARSAVALEVEAGEAFMRGHQKRDRCREAFDGGK